MDIQIYQPIMFITAIIGGALSHYSQTYNGSILILPANDKMQGLLTSTLSEARDWCINNLAGSTLPRIIEDRDSIVEFIQRAVMAQKLGSGQSVLVNGIQHILGNWSWINGFSSKDIEVKGVGLRQEVKSYHPVDLYLYGYLWTEGEYSINAARPIDQRNYICEYVNFTRCPLNISHKCYRMKTDQSTWFQARDKCVKEKGDLASFETLNDKTLKVSLQNLSLNHSKSYWIGIQRAVYHLDENASEINFINWTDDHQEKLRTCLCIQVSPNDVKWIECDCMKSYSFMCTLRDTTDSVAPKISSAASSSALISPTVQSPTYYDTTQLVGALVACVLIVVVITIVIAAVIIRKQRNRPVNSSRSEISTAKTTATTNEFPGYAMIQKPREDQPATNVSTSNTTYATVQVAANFNDESQMNNIVYADLDLPSRA